MSKLFSSCCFAFVCHGSGVWGGALLHPQLITEHLVYNPCQHSESNTSKTDI